MPVIGFLSSGSADAFAGLVVAFNGGLHQAGFVEYHDIAIEYRFADGRYDRLPALAVDLVALRVDVIAATGTSAPGLAAKAATATIPIVFQTGGDPVKDGLVDSLSRPSANVTGVTRLTREIVSKRLELLRRLVPSAKSVAVLVNPTNPIADSQVAEMQEPARALGIDLGVVKASTEQDLQSAFASAAQRGASAVIVANEASYTAWRQQIAAAALRNGLPTMVAQREYVVAGALISYDSSPADSYRQVGLYVGRILKGTKPADLPVEQPTRYEVVINLKTAKALGIDVPPAVLAIADMVIE